VNASRNQSSVATLDTLEYDPDAFKSGIPLVRREPIYVGPGVEFWLGDNRQVLDLMDPRSIQAVGTSPPYYGLRQYDGPPSIWNSKGMPCPSCATDTLVVPVVLESCRTCGGTGKISCVHQWDAPIEISIHDNYNADFNERWGNGSGKRKQEKGKPKRLDQGRFCTLCNCWLGRLGNEPYPQLYIDNLMEIFDRLLRVVREDGTLWVVIGDSYAGSGRGPSGSSGIGGHGSRQGFEDVSSSTRSKRWREHPGWWGLPDKSLMMIPARFAIEMQRRGWVLRNDAIWDKPNVIPASVRDRLTVNHEYIYLFSKRPDKYYFDIEAIKEPIADASRIRYQQNIAAQQGSGRAHAFGQGHDGPLKAVGGAGDMRQKRSVWHISTRSTDVSSEHTATFPPKVVEPMVLASTSEAGACPKCQAPFKRMMFKLSKAASSAKIQRRTAALATQRTLATNGAVSGGTEQSTLGFSTPINQTITYGWKPTCRCGCQRDVDGKACGEPWKVLTPAPTELVWNEKTQKHRKVVTGPSTERFACGHEPARIPCRVMDPFGGYGTLLTVARQHNRHGVYIDVGEAYALSAVRRAERTQPGLGLF
jgi:DNA modification methylase